MPRTPVPPAATRPASRSADVTSERPRYSAAGGHKRPDTLRGPDAKKPPSMDAPLTKKRKKARRRSGADEAVAPSTDAAEAPSPEPDAAAGADTGTPASTIAQGLPASHVLTPLPSLSGKYAAIDLSAPPPEVAAADAPAVPSAVDADSRNDAADSAFDPKTLTRQQRRVEALNLRIKGHTYREIAEALQVSTKSAYFDVQEALRYLAKFERVLAEDVRAMHLARLDALTTFLWPAAEGGDTFAIQQVLSVMQRQAKLLGLDAPIEIDVNLRRPLREAGIDDLLALAQRLKDGRTPKSIAPTSAGTFDVDPRPLDLDADTDEDGE